MKIHRYTIPTRDYGDLKILRPVPQQSQVAEDGAWSSDPWGVLSPLRDSSWSSLIPVVDGEVFSHALHGHARPLIEVIGPAPRSLLRLIPEESRRCWMDKNCISYSPKTCFPGKRLPVCFEPMGVEEAARRAASTVALAWAENRYVIVVEGDEFSL